MPPNPTTTETRQGTRTEAPPSPVVHERVVVIPTRGYWIVIGVTAIIMAFTFTFGAQTLSAVHYILYVATLFLCGVVLLIAGVGLSRRYRIIHRTVRRAKRATVGAVDAVRARGEAHEGAWERFATRWSRRLGVFGTFVVWLFRLPVRIVIWTWYFGEKLFWRIILIGYDLIYYPLYAAWQLAHFAARVANRIFWFALRVAWKVLKLPLKLPVARTWWRKSARPKILASWTRFQAHRAHRRAVRIDKGRRLAVLHGRNPDRWEADFKIRRGFPLPHPERARVSIRKRIAHISAVQRARREGRPIPKQEKVRLERPTPPDAEDQPSAAAAPDVATERRRVGAILGRRRDRSGEDKPETAEATTPPDA